jgi:hypothetical protein
MNRHAHPPLFLSGAINVNATRKRQRAAGPRVRWFRLLAMHDFTRCDSLASLRSLSRRLGVSLAFDAKLTRLKPRLRD